MATVAHKPDRPHRPPVERPDRLTPADLAAFQRLGIPSELLVEAQVHRVSDREAMRVWVHWTGGRRPLRHRVPVSRPRDGPPCYGKAAPR